MEHLYKRITNVLISMTKVNESNDMFDERHYNLQILIYHGYCLSSGSVFLVLPFSAFKYVHYSK